MNDTNLIPVPLRIARSRRRRIKAWSVTVMAALFLLCIPVVFDHYLRVEASRLGTQNEELGGVLTGLRQQLATLTAEADRSLLQLERAKALRSKRAWSAMFATIARSMPDGCWLTSIATDPSSPPGGAGLRPRVTATGKTNRQAGLTGSDESVTKIEGPQRLKIVGYASDASEPYQFVTNLKNTNVFRDVVLETSRRERVQDQQAGLASAWYFRFDLACEW